MTTAVAIVIAIDVVLCFVADGLRQYKDQQGK